MAKAARGVSLRKKSNQNADQSDVEEVIDSSVDDSSEQVEETENSSDDLKSEMMADMVSVSVFEEIKPAPTVGHISLVRDFGMSILPKGVVKVPRSVAIVLADKKLAQIIG